MLRRMNFGKTCVINGLPSLAGYPARLGCEPFDAICPQAVDTSLSGARMAYSCNSPVPSKAASELR